MFYITDIFAKKAYFYFQKKNNDLVTILFDNGCITLNRIYIPCPWISLMEEDIAQYQWDFHDVHNHLCAMEETILFQYATKEKEPLFLLNSTLSRRKVMIRMPDDSFMQVEEPFEVMMRTRGTVSYMPAVNKSIVLHVQGIRETENTYHLVFEFILHQPESKSDTMDKITRIYAEI